MILELTRLLLSILLREEGGYIRRRQRKTKLDPDAAVVYKIGGVDDTFLVDVDGVGLLLAPGAVASRFRSREPEKKEVRIYTSTRELVSQGLSGLIGKEGGVQEEEQ